MMETPDSFTPQEREAAELLADRIRHRGDHSELLLDEAVDAILAYASEVRRQERERIISEPLQDDERKALHDMLAEAFSMLDPDENVELCERINHAIGPCDGGKCVPLQSASDRAGR